MADSEGMLDAWIRRMAAAKVLMGDPAALESELSGWLDLLDRAALGEAWAETELSRIVAFHARNHGAEGRPASCALMQLLLLEDCLEDVGRSAETRELTRKLVRLVADAHEAGAAQRMAAKHRSRLTSMSPVIRIPERAVIGFLIGPMEAELLDALFGRVLRESVRIGAGTIVIDCLGAEDEEDIFYRTIKGMQRQPPGDRLRLILTGMRDPERSRQGLLDEGANLDLVAFRDDVSEVIVDLG